jgi:hypothetical protein
MPEAARSGKEGEAEAIGRTPRPGDRIELAHVINGVRRRGTIHYVDDLQMLVKWDDGRSQGLRTPFPGFRIIEDN